MEKKLFIFMRVVSPLSYLTVMGYELNFAGKSSKDCGAPCNSPFFDESERTTLRYWISSWAAVTAICCLFTVSVTLLFYNNTTDSLSYCQFIISSDPDIHYWLVEIPISRAADRVPIDMLFACWHSICLWLGRRWLDRMSWAISAQLEIGTTSDDLDDNSGERIELK